MKKYFFLLFLSTQLLALNPPKVIYGAPNFMAGKGVTLQSGKTKYIFTLPEGYGVGQTDASESEGHFALFPARGGTGCSIHVNTFASEEDAYADLIRIKATFSKQDDAGKTFEVKLKNGWYQGYVSGVFVIQTWYILPKKEKMGKNQTKWDLLKNSLRVEYLGRESSSKSL